MIVSKNRVWLRLTLLDFQCNTDKLGLEKKTDDADKKTSDASGLAKETDYNAKVTEIECKIHSITGLAT